MSALLTPDFGVPLPKEVPYVDLRERVDTLCNTLAKLSEQGVDVNFEDATIGDKEIAAELVKSYAADPEKASKKFTSVQGAKMTPASLAQVRVMLDEFGRQTVMQANEVRNLVMNKLLIETDNPDPRIRMRALENLGKVSDVALFSERSEVLVTHQSSDELKAQLREKLQRLLDNNKPSTGIVFDGEAINVDDELGVADE